MGMHFKVVVCALTALALGTMSAMAQMAPAAKPACAQMDMTLPPDLAVWAVKSDLTSAAKAADLPKAALLPDQAVTAALHPTREVAYVIQPEKPGGSVASGGMFDLNVETAATYRIVLSSGAWIDLLKDGKPLVSSAHTPGPACTTARKIVDFPLEKGHYVLQISANADPSIGILVLQRR